MGIERIASIESMGSIPYAVAAVAWLFFAAWSAGRLLRMTLCDRQDFEVSHEIVLILAGLHSIGLCAVCLGMLGALGGVRSLILLGVLSSVGIVEAWRSKLPSRLMRSCRQLLCVKPCWEWWIVTPFVVFTLGPALNYPTGWDELVYHSVLPRRWMTDGWPAFYVDIPYSGFPSLVEILCWLVAPVESLITARLMVWVCWILCLVLAYTVLRRGTDRTCAFCIAIALAASPISLMISANCYVEAIQLLDLLAIFVLVHWSKLEFSSRPLVHSVLIGILVGGSVAVKLTGAIMIVVPLFWYFKNGLTDKRLAAKLPIHCATIAITSLLVSVPFYLRPWIFAGSPFYPYFANWFSNDASVIETSLYHHSIGADAFGMRGFVAFLVTLILLAWDNDLYDGTLGWQWIILLGLSFASLRNIRTTKNGKEQVWLGAVALVLYSFWFLSAQQARFALPLFATVAVWAKYGLQEIVGKRKTFVSALLVGLTILSLPWANAGYYFASWERLLGIWSNTQYVDDSLEVEYVPLVAAIEKYTSTDARLLLLFEHRSLFVPRQCIIGTPFFQAEGLTRPERYSDPKRVMQYLNEKKISHILFATKPLGPDRSNQWWNRGEPLFVSIEKGTQLGYLKVLWTTDHYVLLQVEDQGN